MIYRFLFSRENKEATWFQTWFLAAVQRSWIFQGIYVSIILCLIIAIVSLFWLRKNCQWQSNITNRKKKDLHHLKICPIPNCFADTKRMDHHLKTKKHNLTSKSKMFYPYLKLVKAFDPNVLPDITEYSPGIFLIQFLKNDMPRLPVAQVTDESSNSSSL